MSSTEPEASGPEVPVDSVEAPITITQGEPQAVAAPQAGLFGMRSES